MVDGDVLSNHSETRAEQFRERPCVHEDDRRSTLVQGIVDRRKSCCGLGGDIEVSSRLEILVDWSWPFEPVLVEFLEIRVERSEEHTSELQSRVDLVCRLLLEKK